MSDERWQSLSDHPLFATSPLTIPALTMGRANRPSLTLRVGVAGIPARSVREVLTLLWPLPNRSRMPMKKTGAKKAREPGIHMRTPATTYLLVGANFQAGGTEHSRNKAVGPKTSARRLGACFASRPRSGKGSAASATNGAGSDTGESLDTRTRAPW